MTSHSTPGFGRAARPDEDRSARLATLDHFPGWERAPRFLMDLIDQMRAKTVGDVGGGRMPRISRDFIESRGLAYHLFDISQAELDLADPRHVKVCLDIASPDGNSKVASLAGKFDLIFSHMLLEHVADPMQAHRNMFRMLRPGGLSVHMFPSRNNFPLFVNGLIPEKVSYGLLKVLQPHRDTAGQEGKFEAYYHHCGAPSDTLRRAYEEIGFEVLQHTSYVGHDYYKRIKPLAMVERGLRPLIVKLGLPIITANLLILRKPLSN